MRKPSSHGKKLKGSFAIVLVAAGCQNWEDPSRHALTRPDGEKFRIKGGAKEAEHDAMTQSRDNK